MLSAFTYFISFKQFSFIHSALKTNSSTNFYSKLLLPLSEQESCVKNVRCECQRIGCFILISVFCQKLLSLEKKNLPEGAFFILEHPFAGRGKWLFALYAFVFLMQSLFQFYLFSLAWEQGDTGLIVSFGIAALFMFLSFRYIASAWRKDTLLVTGDNIILTERKGFENYQRVFARSGVTNLRFLEKPELTPHPLAGKTFDYLGFQVQQQVINEMFGDHRVAFDYEGKIISFGRKLFSWDYVAILEALGGAVVEKEEELPWNTASSWERYWEAYDAFVKSIPGDRVFIREELDNAKLYAEEWVDHRDTLKELRVRYEDQLTTQQIEQLDELIAYVDEVVRSYEGT